MFGVRQVVDHPPLHSGSEVSQGFEPRPVCRWPTLKVVEGRAFQLGPELIGETLKGASRLKGLEARRHPHRAQVQPRRISRRRQNNVAAVNDFLLDGVLHAREVQIKHWMVGDADTVVHDILQGQWHTVAKCCDDRLPARHFGLFKYLVPHVRVQGTRLGILADGRQQTLRHPLE
jgi:hypothetical protein